MSEIDGGPAFPSEQGETSKGWNQTYESGLTKREWFAGMALQGLLSDPSPTSRGCAEAVACRIGTGETISSFTEIVAKAAYHYADAMIRAGKGEK